MPDSLTIEPWEIDRATWNHIQGQRLARELPIVLADLERAATEAEVAAVAQWNAHAKWDRRSDKQVETWDNLHERERWYELTRESRRLRGYLSTARDIVEYGRWTHIYDAAGYELGRHLGFDPDKFRARIVALSDVHERAVRERLAAGHPVATFVARDYALNSLPFLPTKAA